MIRKFSFTSGQKSVTFCNVVAKSTAEPENSNDLQLANSTPPACFFIRSTRTPQERPERLSMVACSGKGSALCCVPIVAVSQPVARYRQALRSKAIAPKNSQLEQIAMIYKFLCLNRTKHTYNQETIYIEADSEENARFQLTADYRLLLDRPIGKFHQHANFADFRQNLTDCASKHLELLAFHLTELQRHLNNGDADRFLRGLDTLQLLAGGAKDEIEQAQGGIYA